MNVLLRQAQQFGLAVAEHAADGGIGEEQSSVRGIGRQDAFMHTPENGAQSGLGFLQARFHLALLGDVRIDAANADDFAAIVAHRRLDDMQGERLAALQVGLVVIGLGRPLSITRRSSARYFSASSGGLSAKSSLPTISPGVSPLSSAYRRFTAR